MEIKSMENNHSAVEKINRSAPDLVRNIKKGEEIISLKRFFELSSDMNCITDGNGYFKEISDSFERTLGYSKQELLSKPYNCFIIDEDQYKTDNEVSSLNQGNSTQHFENRYKCKDGSIRWFAWKTSAPKHDNLIYGIARDITEQKKNDQKTKEYAQQLEVFKEENLGSLRYARLLQEAILQDPEKLNDIFPQSFIYNSPKNIVSGDFYWFEKNGNNVTLACADCTGHGTPGAMLSILGMNKLHEIIGSRLLTSPAKILDSLNKSIYDALGKKNGTKKMSDGMDLALYSLDLKTNILEFAGANNSLYIIRDGVLIKLAADKKCIGASLDQNAFENKMFEVKTGDMLYVFSDGYADQFGGDKNKKYGFKRFAELLISIHRLEAVEQKEILKNTVDSWKQDMEQTDDVLVIGIRV